MTRKIVRMSISVDFEKQQKLEEIAKIQDRSRNWIVNQAIKNYLDMYDHQAIKMEEVNEKYPSVKF